LKNPRNPRHLREIKHNIASARALKPFSMRVLQRPSAGNKTQHYSGFQKSQIQLAQG
jgi:hypothetical protein